MARVIFGSIATEIRGSIGGTTFQRNAYGFTVKNKANQVNPNTAFQQVMRQALVTSTQQWGTPGLVNQDDWNNYQALFPQYAKFNTSSLLTGFNVFVKRNTLPTAWVIQGNRLDVTPNDWSTLTVVSEATANVVLAPTILLDTELMSFRPNPLSAPTDLVAFIFLSSTSSTNRGFRRNLVKLIKDFDLDSDNQNILVEYMAVFNRAPVVGEWIQCSVIIMGKNTGAVYNAQDFNIQLAHV